MDVNEHERLSNIIFITVLQFIKNSTTFKLKMKSIFCIYLIIIVLFMLIRHQANFQLYLYQYTNDPNTL